MSGTEVLPSVLSGLQVSLALMGASLGVALLLACALVAPVLVRSRASAGRGPRCWPPYPSSCWPRSRCWCSGCGSDGCRRPAVGPQNMVLPAVALGVPGGGLLGRLVADALPAVLEERWVELWRGAGVSRARIAGAALRRVLPPLVPQFAMVAVGLTGGAVAVETVFAVPGIAVPRSARPSHRTCRCSRARYSRCSRSAWSRARWRRSPGGGCWARPCVTPRWHCLRHGRCAHTPRSRWRCSPSSP
ncbi:hypothetical protein GCM10011428_32040 [Streptomyces violaceus]